MRKIFLIVNLLFLSLFFVACSLTDNGFNSDSGSVDGEFLASAQGRGSDGLQEEDSQDENESEDEISSDEDQAEVEDESDDDADDEDRTQDRIRDEEIRLRAKMRMDNDDQDVVAYPEAYVEFRQKDGKKYIKCEIENLPVGQTFQCAVEVGGELVVFTEIMINDGETEAEVKLADGDYPAALPATLTVDDKGVILDADGNRLFEANFANK